MIPDPSERNATPQERFWLDVYQQQPDNPSLDLFFIFQGQLIDPCRLARSFEYVITRHDALSTEFAFSGCGEAKARVCDSPEFVWKDWGALSERNFSKRLVDYRFQTIDPTAAPLLEFAFALVDHACRIVCRISHSIADGAAASLVLSEILQHYAGEALAPASTAKLGDFSQSLNECYEATGAQNIDALTKLPRSKPFPMRGGDPDAPAWQALCAGNFQIDREIVRAIRKIARKRKSSLPAQLVAYFGMASARHNKSSTVCFRTLFHGRRDRAFRNLVGFLAGPGCVAAPREIEEGLDVITADLSKGLKRAHKASSTPLYSYLSSPQARERVPRLEFNFVRPAQGEPEGFLAMGIEPLFDYTAVPALWDHPHLPTDLIVYNQERHDGTISVDLVGPKRIWGEEELKHFGYRYRKIIDMDVRQSTDRLH